MHRGRAERGRPAAIRVARGVERRPARSSIVLALLMAGDCARSARRTAARAPRRRRRTLARCDGPERTPGTNRTCGRPGSRSDTCRRRATTTSSRSSASRSASCAASDAGGRWVRRSASFSRAEEAGDRRERLGLGSASNDQVEIVRPGVARAQELQSREPVQRCGDQAQRRDGDQFARLTGRRSGAACSALPKCVHQRMSHSHVRNGLLLALDCSSSSHAVRSAANVAGVLDALNVQRPTSKPSARARPW